jgi:F-type H+-transporting ATPase subunit gamma
MPSLIDLRRRVRAVKNTQQITKAMKMVAASKLRRAQDRIVNGRPYARAMQRLLTSLASRVDPSMHPLLTMREPRPDSRTLILVVTGDKGLCGSFNTNVIKAAVAEMEARKGAYTLALVGRKGRDFFIRRGFPVSFELSGIFHQLKYQHAQAIARAATEGFVEGEVDRVQLVYNEFKSVMQQRVVSEQMLPIPRAEYEGQGEGAIADVEYLYDPAPQRILEQLLPRYVEVMAGKALLESNAAFYAAQMTAMDSATKNSADMIASLTLYMNKVRQAAITREIIEVVSGAEAL